MSIFARFLLTFTSMTPAFLIAAFVLWPKEKIYSIILLILSLLFIIIMYIIIKIIQKYGEKISIKFKSAKIDNNSNIDYLMFYLSPLLVLDSYSKLRALCIIAFVFVIAKTASADCSFNPVLRVFGWRFYSIEESNNISYLIMTKKPIRDTQKPIEIVRLTEYVLLRVD
ncbi:MAG: hypothetical protein DU429_03045 [Candidatus Tokpelaia sp.]|nr:MAG: hypothetical protein DU430_05790 [Candidatus Tokpelaia sp.]KAA6207442.1 MAG: hypothetical protein DU429_03045 [Candidatus Tokpelaia sp.]